jgi:hypothetical protein
VRSSSEIQTSGIEDVVYHALAGKYPDADADLKKTKIQPAIERAFSVSLEDLPDVGTFVDGLDQDVMNQVATLARLERDWTTRPQAEVDLKTMHRALCGSGSLSPGPRTNEFVQDFEGVPPAPLEDLEARRNTLDQSLKCVDELKSATLERKSDYLAWLFSSIIAAHIFADGNGRLARTAVQYCLRRWNMPFIPVPKVRNAAGWKGALHNAIDGNTGALASYISRLIGNQTIEQIERSLKDTT